VRWGCPVYTAQVMPEGTEITSVIGGRSGRYSEWRRVRWRFVLRMFGQKQYVRPSTCKGDLLAVSKSESQRHQTGWHAKDGRQHGGWAKHLRTRVD
jgi:hypothetical protein